MSWYADSRTGPLPLIAWAIVAFFDDSSLISVQASCLFLEFAGIAMPQTEVFAGAMPPLIGWAAITNTITTEGLLLFVIVFCETGLVVTPFLPGDSLLFIVGALCGADLMSLPLAMALLLAAAIAGDQTNYSLGRYFGPKVFRWENSRLFNRQAFDQAHAFYERYGGITIVLVTHEPDIAAYAKRLVRLKDGLVLYDGPAAEGLRQLAASHFTEEV